MAGIRESNGGNQGKQENDSGTPVAYRKTPCMAGAPDGLHLQKGDKKRHGQSELAAHTDHV